MKSKITYSKEELSLIKWGALFTGFIVGVIIGLYVGALLS